MPHANLQKLTEQIRIKILITRCGSLNFAVSVFALFSRILKEKHCSFLLSDKTLNHLDCLELKLSEKNED